MGLWRLPWDVERHNVVGEHPDMMSASEGGHGNEEEVREVA